MVNVGGAACACGGTHVKNTADIRGLTVTKIKKVRDILTQEHIIAAMTMMSSCALV